VLDRDEGVKHIDYDRWCVGCIFIKKLDVY